MPVEGKWAASRDISDTNYDVLSSPWNDERNDTSVIVLFA